MPARTPRRQGASTSAKRPASARRSKRPAPVRSRQDPRARRPLVSASRLHTGQRVASGTVVLAGAAILSLAALVPTVNTYVAQQQEYARVQAQLEHEQERVEELDKQIARWQDPNFVAAQARERLLFAMPGETQYRLTDSSGREVPASQARLAEIEENAPSWFGSLWDSLVASSQAQPPAAREPVVDEEVHE